MNIIETDMYKKLIETIKAARFAVLATEKNKGPYLSLVGFLLDEDLKNLYFYTPVQSRKYDNIISNPSVSLLIDSREKYASQTDMITAVTLTGIANAVKKPERNILKEYLSRYPELKNFTDSGLNVLIKVNIIKYIIVSNFSQVSEIVIN
ncbi:MAG: pyridoxamine 5'-phosphate oxidase family protein [Actinobacteria bacterium]|nr:pyridoxamine 5'-phosphate oxidase family protein [Actinomycetota bacterium]